MTKKVEKRATSPRPRRAGLTAPPPGARFVPDYISATQVRATAEELDAVQVFARRLVEDYGYSKSQIQTHPQYRVRVRPSDEDKSYPVDIAVFRSSKKTEDELFMVVECKKQERRDGEHQLRLYMDMSAAEIGVWFNGRSCQSVWKSVQAAALPFVREGRIPSTYVAP
jgi:type I restriction enzyme M protein